MSNVLKFHMVRHGPVSNPNGLWYGRDIEFDLTSPSVVEHFNHLACILPANPETSIWIASEYPRARCLAEEILNAVPQKPAPQLILDKNFIEQQYGMMEGMLGQDARNDPRLASYFADMWNAPPPDGESMSMLQNRVGGRMDHLSVTLPDHITDVVVVAHGGVNMAAFSHATGQRMIDVFKARKGGMTPSFSYASRLELHFDRADKKWSDAFEYDTGLPKPGL